MQGLRGRTETGTAGDPAARPGMAGKIGQSVARIGSLGAPENAMDCGVMEADAVREMCVTYWERLGKISRFYEREGGLAEITCRLR